MAKPLNCEDQYGYQWLVYEGDPAHDHIARLNKLGVSYCVLHRTTLLTGSLEVQIRVPEIAPEALTADLAPLSIRLTRARDCLQWLREEVI